VLVVTVGLIDIIFIKTKVNDINAVLPVVEGDISTNSYPPYTGQCRTLSSYRCSPWSCKIRHYQKLFKISCEIKVSSVLINMVYHSIASLIMMINILAMPIEFVRLFNTNYDGQEVYFYASYTLPEVCWNIPVITPIFIYEWTKHKNGQLVVKASRECFSARDTTEKKFYARL
ncbi:hypothetical protein J6590_107212, partial [Homalodisca vitripennis]